MARKILYSPGFGAGWVSWSSSLTREQRQMMLEHKSLVEAVEKGEPVVDDSTSPPTPLQPMKDFLQDFNIMWPDAEEPYLGGARRLKVMEVGDYDLVRINDYDGNEKVEVLETVECDFL